MRAIRRIPEVVALGWLLSAHSANADPQFTTGLTLGGGASELRTRGPIGMFDMGLRSDVLFLRHGDHDMGLGPYVELLTVGFETFEVGGGVSWLIPITDQVPILISAGAHARGYEGGWEPGVHAMIWMGSRSYNFHSLYGLAIGGFVEGRWGLGNGQQADVLGGVQLDLELFVLPFLLLYNAFR